MEKFRKQIFIVLTICIAGAVFLFSYLTPMLSDDFLYGMDAAEIHSVADLFRQEYEHYMGHSGRSVVHLFVRSFLKCPLTVFDICNSLVFTAVVLMMYANVAGRKKYDIRLLLCAFFLIWFKGVSFEETVLWQVGATNYLWGTCIILGFVTLYRHLLKKEARLPAVEDGKNGMNAVKGIGKALLIFLFGVAAGWCNENTSGGGFLLCACFLGLYLLEDRKRRPATWMLTGLVGQLIGIFMMVMSPGERLRATFAEEEHSGFLKYLGRFQKLTLSVREEFFLLLGIWILLFVLCRVQKCTWERLQITLIYMFVFLATTYALVAAAPAQPRALFGAGVFLSIAILNVLWQVQWDKNELLQTFCYGSLAILILHFGIGYLDHGTNLYRIYRDENERQEYIISQREAGSQDILVPQMRPDFETSYSAIYKMDMEEDPEYWINIAYELYFDVEYIRALPREEWEELTGYGD